MNTPGNHSCACFDGYVNSGRNGTDVICIDIGKTFTQWMSLVFSFPFLFVLCVSFVSYLVVSFFISFDRSVLMYLPYQDHYQMILPSIRLKFIRVSAKC